MTLKITRGASLKEENPLLSKIIHVHSTIFIDTQDMSNNYK